MTPGAPGEDRPRPPREFAARVGRQRERKERYAREGNRSFWSSVGMAGTVGWSVALPMAAGALFGRWLDNRLDAGHVFMIFFLLVGVGAGCTIAWRLIAERL